MNKSLVLVFFCIGALFSCSKKKDKIPTASSGKINSISLVIDEKLWNGVIGDSIRNKFANPVDGLQKEEPQFDINQYPINLMEGFMTKSRTIIVIKTDDRNSFVIKKNQYASPQTVFHIFGRTRSRILDIIEQNAPKMIQIIKLGELTEHQRLLNDSILSPRIIAKQFKIGIKVPIGFNYVLQKDHFIWLKREFMSGSSSLLITQVPIATTYSDRTITERMLKVQDSIGALYIKGAESISTMSVDRTYPTYFSTATIDGRVTFQVKGTWRLKDSFMSGPFVNYMILDPDKNKALLLIGFTYSPSRDKRNFMHELQAIIEGVHVQ